MEAEGELRRALLLMQTHRFSECASFIQSLDAKLFFFNILPLFSMENLLANLPHTLEVIEALLLHVCAISDHSATVFVCKHSEAIAMRIVRFYASKTEDASTGSQVQPNENQDGHDKNISNIVRVLSLMDPMVKKYLLKRKRVLNRCLDEMGSHGLVQIEAGQLSFVSDALKMTLESVIGRHKTAVKQMDILSLMHGRPKQRPVYQVGRPKERSVSNGPAPSAGSHQRLLQVTPLDVEDRLYKNTEILNAIQPSLEASQLETLTQTLRERIEMDKDLLLHYTQLRKEMNMKLLPDDEEDFPERLTGSEAAGLPLDFTSVSTILRNYIFGFRKVLESMRVSGAEIDKIEKKSQARTSQTLSKTERHWQKQGGGEEEEEGEEEDNILLAFSPRMEGICTLHRRRTVRRNGGTISRVGGQQNGVAETLSKARIKASGEAIAMTATTADLQEEVHQLRQQLAAAQRQIATLQSGGQVEVEILNDSDSDHERHLEENNNNDESNNESMTKEQTSVTLKILANRYENLYRNAQETTLESLEAYPELEHYDDLKTKLLFSIIVLAFRVALRQRIELWTRMRVMLQLPVLPSVGCDGNKRQMNPPCAAVEKSLNTYLQRTVDNFDLSVCVQEVCDQVWQTLYDFPSLKKSASLINFVDDSVRVAWALVSVTPSSLVDFSASHVDPERHVRHPTSDLTRTEIRRFVWPTLVDSEKGAVRSKGVVVT